MAVGFSWKTTVLAGTLSVLAVVFGKVAGGFAAAWAGIRRTVVVSLLLAAVCYMLSEHLLAGILALFLFNADYRIFAGAEAKGACGVFLWLADLWIIYWFSAHIPWYGAFGG